MKDMAEFNALLRNYKTLYDLVNTPLLQLGDDDPPTALDLDQGVDESLLNCSEKVSAAVSYNYIITKNNHIKMFSFYHK